MPTASLHDITVTTIDGIDMPMSAWRGHALLIVNVASRCGYTPQYAGLQRLHEAYASRGFAVLGFPCDQFGHQEPGSHDEIRTFCTEGYGVTFPMFAKIDVNGPAAHPLYQHLKKARKGILGTAAIKWNFTKFLVGPDGQVIERYGSGDTPERIERDVQALLDSSAPRTRQIAPRTPRRVFLIHHADALGPAVDSLRPLSSKGLAQADWLAGQARAAGCAPAAIWHSGKLRARQTAEAFLRVCAPFADFRMVRGLRSDDPPEWMRDEIAADTRDVLLAGHMPHIARLLQLLAPGVNQMPTHGGVALEATPENRWAEVWRAVPPRNLTV
jgi:glutathione peroxidase